MSERAGVWLRVSTPGQDEESQLPDCLQWCESHDYDVAETYTIHGKSAFKGSRKFDAMWSQVIDDIHQGKNSVLVVWKQDRLDRKLNTFQMLAEVVAAGGRVEFVTQPHLNDLTTMGGRIALKVQEEIAYAESKDKSDRILANHAGKRAKGSVIGRAPWGFSIAPGVNADGEPVKIFSPTAEGRRFVPAVFQRVINGASLRDVALWLADNGILANGEAWADVRVARLIRNSVYFGQRVNGGNLVTEGLVSHGGWKAANAAMVSRISGGRSASTHEKALLSPVCGVCDNDSPLYRVFVGPKSHRLAYYRCSRGGPRNRGCGAPMIPVEELDSEVTDVMLSNPNPYVQRVFVPGDDRSEEIGKLRQAAMAAYLNDDRAGFERLDSEARELESEPGTVAHWEEGFWCETCGLVASVADCVKQGHDIKTTGQHFASLDQDARREYLRQNWIVQAEMAGAGKGRHLSAGVMPRDFI